jgi:hypothetical protein
MLLTRFSDREVYLLELTESSSLVTIPDYEVSTVTSRLSCTFEPTRLGNYMHCSCGGKACKMRRRVQLLLAGARVNKP